MTQQSLTVPAGFTDVLVASTASPTALAFTPDCRLLITTQGGALRVVQNGTLLPTAALDLAASICTNSERGLLGIALSPDFADSHELYLAYTALPDGAVTLARYDMDDATLDPLLAQEHAENANHNGGNITFGTDGMLYMSIGDGGGSGDPFDSGQRLDTLLGKILRIDVSRTCGDLPYCVPEDNPFTGVPGARRA